MFTIFPFVVITHGSFRFLPVEIIAMIFRYLDDSSLFSAFSSCQRWAEICRGDPILRRRLRGYVKKVRQERERVFLNPSTGVEIIRAEPTPMFGRNINCNKRIKVEKNVLPKMVRVPKIKKDIQGGPMRYKNYIRHSPYKRMRL
ncbi:hypothetical protein HHI36_023239 [Cryptolaemus montrouzieri]|uniref:F-box domain-containing protein n=1 Tax=Cryptolaemus montrouzieri TaxID=559131 RepID=A0ABD2PG00_9CUCU